MQCPKKRKIFLSPGLEVTKCLSPLDGMLIYASTPSRPIAAQNELDCLIGHLFFEDNAGHRVPSVFGSLECHSPTIQLDSPTTLRLNIWTVFAFTNIFIQSKINFGLVCWSNVKFITRNCYEAFELMYYGLSSRNMTWLKTKGIKFWFKKVANDRLTLSSSPPET